jgi:tRNA1Val (adenine37-N6)-methyltransferase
MNHQFQFKQFTIHQKKCAMKVTEIACIQGAWTEIPHRAKRVLDIGCGTGLLSLMLAQRYATIQIDAIEIDSECLTQAIENVEASLFKKRIHCIQGDVLLYYPDDPYDFIIVNPPFFEKDLKSKDARKNLAWHSEALPLHALIRGINRLLHSDGAFCILLPTSRLDTLERLTHLYDFYLNRILRIQHSSEHQCLHMVCIFSKRQSVIQTENVIIKENQMYTTSFVNLMRDYYLKM